MSWFKKTVKKVKKSLRRAAHGKFHLNPLKNGVHALSDPLGHITYRLLPSKTQRKIRRGLDWGHLKKSHKFGINKLFRSFLGDNSASAYSVSTPYYGPSYTYSGRSVSELM